MRVVWLSSAGYIDVVNKILEYYGLPPQVTALEDCTASMFVALFEAMFQVQLPGIIRTPTTLEHHRINMQAVIDNLQHHFSRLNMAHVTGSSIVNGNPTAKMYLIELLDELHIVFTTTPTRPSSVVTANTLLPSNATQLPQLTTVDTPAQTTTTATRNSATSTWTQDDEGNQGVQSVAASGFDDTGDGFDDEMPPSARSPAVLESEATTGAEAQAPVNASSSSSMARKESIKQIMSELEAASRTETLKRASSSKKPLRQGSGSGSKKTTGRSGRKPGKRAAPLGQAGTKRAAGTTGGWTNVSRAKMLERQAKKDKAALARGNDPDAQEAEARMALQRSFTSFLASRARKEAEDEKAIQESGERVSAQDIPIVARKQAVLDALTGVPGSVKRFVSRRIDELEKYVTSVAGDGRRKTEGSDRTAVERQLLVYYYMLQEHLRDRNVRETQENKAEIAEQRAARHRGKMARIRMKNFREEQQRAVTARALHRADAEELAYRRLFESLLDTQKSAAREAVKYERDRAAEEAAVKAREREAVEHYYTEQLMMMKERAETAAVDRKIAAKARRVAVSSAERELRRQMQDQLEALRDNLQHEQEVFAARHPVSIDT